LAHAIYGNPALPAAAQFFEPNAGIGDVPDEFNPNIDEYQDADILRLVIFYNDDFGIALADTVAIRRLKLRTWLLDQVGFFVN
jgi:hypothetical protein